MFSKANSIKKYKEYPVLISPNLGKPQILSFPKETKEDADTFQVELLFIADYNMTEKDLSKNIEERIEIRPILSLDEKTRRGIRGNPIIGEIVSISKAPIIPLYDPELILNYNYESPRGRAVKEGIYDTKNAYFIVKAEFTFNTILKSIIDKEGMAICDLQQIFPENENLNKINYHAVVINNQTWENCTIIQASDLHLSKRNDEIVPLLLKQMDRNFSKKITNFFDNVTNKKIDDLDKRFINPNNNFRLFVNLMNYFKKNRLVDVIVFTGDIIDFCIRSDGGDSILSFDFKNTNWNIFHKIVLNQPLSFRSDIDSSRMGLIKNEELMVPFYTSVGNHDYRSYHYDLRWIHLTALNTRIIEMIQYNDIMPANPVSALYTNRKTMMGYNQYINPYQDYFVKLGDHILVMLDTGWDSAKATRDLFSGDPSAHGFSEEQLQFTKNIIKHKKGPRGLNMAFFHAPAINPLPIDHLGWNFQNKLRNIGLKTLDDFKESNFKRITLAENPRVDYLLNFKYSCIANNWENTIKLFNDNKFLVLCGHTHRFRECRTEYSEDKSIIPSFNYLILKKELEVPVAIYMEDYSMKYDDPEYFHKHLPFHLQSPALAIGFHGQKKQLSGPFRKIIIKNNKLHSFKIDSASNYLDILNSFLPKQK